MVVLGGVNAGWNPGGSRIGEKSSWLSDDSAASSSEDMSTTTGREKRHTCKGYKKTHGRLEFLP